MPKPKKPGNSEEEALDIDPDVLDVMREHTRVVSGHGPNTAKEAERKQAITKAAMKAIKAKDERAFSAELRRAGVKDGSPEWKKAWEIYRAASGRH
jgi:hypothetical protein